MPKKMSTYRYEIKSSAHSGRYSTGLSGKLSGTVRATNNDAAYNKVAKRHAAARDSRLFKTEVWKD